MRRIHFLRHWLEPRLLAVAAAVTAALWLFIEVGEEVVEGGTHAVDSAILLALRAPGDAGDPLGPPWLEAAARDVTALGSFTVLGLAILSTTAFLLLSGRHRTALFLLLSTGGGTLASILLKAAYDRPRPELVAHGDYVLSASFPSGHAMISALVYLTLGALIARLLPARREKLFVLGVALALSGLVGASRVYLGVHWPTDVLAGWAAGAAWALGCWMIAELRGRRTGAG